MLTCNAYAQIKMEISTDKNTYGYGEKIHLTCTVSNSTDTTTNILVFNFHTCQAEFEFDDYYTRSWEVCAPLSEELVFDPGTVRKYKWTIDPNKLGLPDRDGTHKIISSFDYSLQPYLSAPIIRLYDTTYIDAPVFLGGQLRVGFPAGSGSLLSQLKDSLSVEVLESDTLFGNRTETWQTYGYQIDTLYQKLLNDKRLSWVEYNRLIAYDSIVVTSVEKDETSIADKYYLSDAYPNPFNPTTKIKYELPKSSQIKIIVYDALGKEVKVLEDGYKNAGTHEVEFDGSNLASGIYIYKLYTPEHVESKKMVLLK